MNKERLKSITLVCLIFLNFVLGGFIVTDKKLWPSGYNFFISLENTLPVQLFNSLKAKFAGAPEASTHLTAPETIIINTGYQTSRFSVRADEALFGEITDACSEILAAAFSDSEGIVRVSQDAWYTALMAKSVYLQYPSDCESVLFSQLLGVKNTAVSDTVHSFSRLAVSADEKAAVYIEDSASGAYYRIPTGRTPEALLKLIDTYRTSSQASSTSSSILNYSFDLKFDQPVSGQNAVIDPMVPIYSNPRKAAVLAAENPLRTETGVLDREVLERILTVFDMNPGTVRHYTETGGTLVFVENNAILKLHTDGLLDYRAKGQGVQLDRDGSTYSVLREITELADAVTGAAGAEPNLYITSPLYTDTQNFTFDYMAAGLPVILTAGNTKHAVDVQTENGYLLRYRQLLRRYNTDGTMQETPAYITALDNAIAEYSASMNEIVIEKIYLSYTDDGTNTAQNADWTVEVKSLVVSGE